jgi:hypothetical protein
VETRGDEPARNAAGIILKIYFRPVALRSSVSAALDDVLKDRLATLKAARDRANVALERAKVGPSDSD